MADAAEGVIASIAAAGGDDEVVFAAGDWVAKDDFASEPFSLKLHSLLLEGVFMVGILSLKGDRKR